MLRNAQAPEKQVQHDGTELAVNSLFYTIQGEGPFAGTPAVFIRLAGCNLQCPLCDTAYTARDTYPVHELVSMVAGYKTRMVSGRQLLVVITGGEPFRQPIGHLAQSLIDDNCIVQIETNGTLYQPGPWYDDNVTIVCSPKATGVNHKLLPFIAAFKYVARAQDIQVGTGLPTVALEHPNAKGLYIPPGHHHAVIYLQPADEQDADANLANQRAVVQACMDFGWRLCLQVHKIVNVP